MNKKFVTAINCIDGRVQIPVIEWLKKEAQEIGRASCRERV